MSTEAGNILKRLRSSTNPVQLADRSAWPTIAALTFNWVVVCGAIFWMSLTSWWVHLLLLLIVATRQHALLVLLHDPSHFLHLHHPLHLGARIRSAGFQLPAWRAGSDFLKSGQIMCELERPSHILATGPS